MTNRIQTPNTYGVSRKNPYPTNQKSNGFWRPSIEWSPESEMTKGIAYEETSIPNLPENAEVLKDEMSHICDQFQINESDLMRRAISEFVQSHTENPEKNGKLMFV